MQLDNFRRHRITLQFNQHDARSILTYISLKYVIKLPDFIAIVSIYRLTHCKEMACPANTVKYDRCRAIIIKL